MPELVEGHIYEADGHVRAPSEALLPQALLRAPLEIGQVETGVDEGAARRSLRGQIAKLERELAAVFASAYPRKGIELRVRAPGGPRVLGVGELEEVRDELAARLEDARRTVRDRAYVQRKNVTRIDEMIAEPGRFKWVRISNEDIGEPGCKYWHSRPRLGLIGMLLGWWRVKISSGCP
jgi:hypothetical protein